MLKPNLSFVPWPSHWVCVAIVIETMALLSVDCLRRHAANKVYIPLRLQRDVAGRMHELGRRRSSQLAGGVRRYQCRCLLTEHEPCDPLLGTRHRDVQARPYPQANRKTRAPLPDGQRVWLALLPAILVLSAAGRDLWTGKTCLHSPSTLQVQSFTSPRTCRRSG